MGKTIREFATEFSTDIKQAQDQNQNLLLENTEIKEKLAEEKSKSWFKRLFKK